MFQNDLSTDLARLLVVWQSSGSTYPWAFSFFVPSRRANVYSHGWKVIYFKCCNNIAASSVYEVYFIFPFYSLWLCSSLVERLEISNVETILAVIVQMRMGEGSSGQHPCLLGLWNLQLWWVLDFRSSLWASYSCPNWRFIPAVRLTLRSGMERHNSIRCCNVTDTRWTKWRHSQAEQCIDDMLLKLCSGDFQKIEIRRQYLYPRWAWHRPMHILPAPVWGLMFIRCITLLKSGRGI